MKKRSTSFEILLLAIISFPLAFAAYHYDQLPETIVTHYNMKGEADGWASKSFAHFLVLPGINFMLNLFLFSLPGLIPEEQRSALTLRMLNATRFATALLLSGIAVLMVTSADQQQSPNVDRWVGGGLFLLMLLIGNYMKEIKPNEFAGIRNAYTKDPAVWKKTHQRAAYWFFHVGWIGLTAAFLVDVPYMLFISIGILLLLCLFSWIISKREYHKHHELS